MRTLAHSTILGLLAALSGCAASAVESAHWGDAPAASSDSRGFSEYSRANTPIAHFAAPAESPNDAVHFFDDSGATEPEETVDPAEPSRRRLMTYSARVAIEVARQLETIRALEAEAVKLGGYLVARQSESIVLRVPADEFRSFLDFVRARGRVLDESMEAQDVTKQHRDLQIRLDNAKKARERLIALLEKADKVEDILRIEKELTRLTTEIESATAALANLDERIAFSHVSVSVNGVRPREAREPRRSDFQWINAVGAERVLAWF